MLNAGSASTISSFDWAASGAALAADRTMAAIAKVGTRIEGSPGSHVRRDYAERAPADQCSALRRHCRGRLFPLLRRGSIVATARRSLNAEGGNAMKKTILAALA